MLSSGTKQSFIAIMDSRHIYHAVSPQEVIDFFFFLALCPVMRVLIREGQQQFIKELMLKSSCLREDEFGRGVSPGLPTDREVGTGTGI